MATELPRVIGLKDLLALREQIKEKPAPLVFFSMKEFERLLRGIEPLKRAPKATFGRPSFVPVSGGMVQSGCDSPPGQVCVGQWVPAGPGHRSGIFFGCRCRPVVAGPSLEPVTCRVRLDEGGFSCAGDCKVSGRRCALGYWKDQATGVYTLDCRCRPLTLRPA